MGVLISIIVPVYKVESYIDRCLESLIGQTYKDIEIILVDDGSPDNCGIICDEYAKRDNRIVVVHKQNGGLSSARNAGLNIFKGEYVMFVDSDDWVEPNFCEAALQLICSKAVDCVLFGYYEHIKNTKKTYTIKDSRYLSSEEAIRYIVKNDEPIYVSVWNKIYHRSLFECIRFPEGYIYEDQGTTYKLFDLSKNIFVSDIPLYNYLRRLGSITLTPNLPQYTNDKFDMWAERLVFLEDKYPSIAEHQIRKLAILCINSLTRVDWSHNRGIEKKISDYLNTHQYDIVKMKMPLMIKTKLLCFYHCYPLFDLFCSTTGFRLKVKACRRSLHVGLMNFFSKSN